MGVLDEWTQLDEAMKITGRSKFTIYRWVRQGIVRAVRPADVLWFNIADLRTAKRNTPGRPRAKT